MGESLLAKQTDGPCKSAATPPFKSCIKLPHRRAEHGPCSIARDPLYLCLMQKRAHVSFILAM